MGKIGQNWVRGKSNRSMALRASHRGAISENRRDMPRLVANGSTRYASGFASVHSTQNPVPRIHLLDRTARLMRRNVARNRNGRVIHLSYFFRRSHMPNAKKNAHRSARLSERASGGTQVRAEDLLELVTRG